MMAAAVVVVMMKEAAKGQARGGTLASCAHFFMPLFYFSVQVNFYFLYLASLAGVKK